jgi:hypothetical protein
MELIGGFKQFGSGLGLISFSVFGNNLSIFIPKRLQMFKTQGWVKSAAGQVRVDRYCLAHSRQRKSWENLRDSTNVSAK